MKIDEGYTFSYIFTAIAFFTVGVILTYFFLWIGIAIITIGLFLLFVKTGILIDNNNFRIGRYSSLFGKSRIDWTSVSDFNKAKLDFEFTSMSLHGPTTSTSVSPRSYTLILIGNDSNKTICEFSDYNTAKTVLKSIGDKFGIQVVDSYKEIQRKALKTKHRRRKN